MTGFICILAAAIAPLTFAAASLECNTTFATSPNDAGCRGRYQLWSAPSGKEILRTAAAEYCRALPPPRATFKPWRLPTLEELKAFAEEKPFRVMDPTFDNFYWTEAEGSKNPEVFHPLMKNTLTVSPA